MKLARIGSLWALLALVAALVASCADEQRPEVLSEQTPGRGGSTESPDARAIEPGQMQTQAQGKCPQAHAEALPASLAAMAGAPAEIVAAVETVQAVVDQIGSNCATGGGCHSTAGNLFFVTRPSDLLKAGQEGFATQGEWALAHIEGDLKLIDPSKACALGDSKSCMAMPPIDPTVPTGKAWDDRLKTGRTDEISQLDQSLRAWLAAGKPVDQFSMATADAGTDAGGAAADGGTASPYALPPRIGNGLTNLGNCVPDRALVATETAAMDALDAKFAALKRAPVGTTDSSGQLDQAQVIGLPSRLADTDVTTFDTAELARRGVIAFVPQYPLWSDDAGKLRFVRVPRGQSIHLNKATQEFDIPANTRFYKTFLKRIIDTDGNVSYRKIETRLIVSRPDPAGATDHVNALFGSYKWDADEKNATLITNPFADGTGFQDDFFPYDLDINLANSIRDNPPARVSLDLALLNAGAVRHYAIPSSQRCVQCHMGSPGRSFILGFRPVQIPHRPVGEGGVIEASGPDEMTQLQRLIDLGVITGVDSPSDILPLEDAEGDRKPRNDSELTAQGYMLGNCSHCHNPVGYPSFTFHELATTLNFVPGPAGGIFQFPLEKVSPRILRGELVDVQIPYITPSLLDNPSYPRHTVTDPGLGDTESLLTGFGTSAWLPKWPGSDPTTGVPSFIYAPWRSLIYRNVDTPFSYADDNTIYPHMPMNTPGFDCRAKQILGDWMVSIPATRKKPEISEYVYPYPDVTIPGGTAAPSTVNVSDDSPQPYVEVPPGAPGYDAALAAAQDRLRIFHTGLRAGDATSYKGRYVTCPDTTDIVDPEVDHTCHTIPTESQSQDNPLINVPTHPHWVSLDLTVSAMAAWAPRDGTWEQDIVDRNPAPAVDSCGNGQDETAQRQEVVNFLKDVRLDDSVNVTHDDTVATVKDFLTEPMPFGLWKDKPECDWKKLGSAVTTVAQERAKSPHPAWLDGPAGADGTRHVYRESMGAAVFNQVCINCHGADADSKGRLADNLATMTGGNARVADFRDGLFGPKGNPGQNRLAVFGRPFLEADGSVFADKAPAASYQDWADMWGARYMAFMALGGTRAHIPDAFLANVSHTAFFGEFRGAALNASGSGANMLSIGRALCQATIQRPPFQIGSASGYFALNAKATSDVVLFDNGDAEMWLKLCTLNNPPPVAVYGYDPKTPGNLNRVFSAEGDDNEMHIFTGYNEGKLFLELLSSAFPNGDGAPSSVGVVGDETGQVSATLGPQNRMPWCIGDFHYRSGSVPPDDDFDNWVKTACVSGKDCSSSGACVGTGPNPDCVHPPVCPPSAFEKPDNTTGALSPYYDDDVGSHTSAWALRGAINAGLAVFLYLDGITRGGMTPQPAFDQCDQLFQPTSSGGDGGTK